MRSQYKERIILSVDQHFDIQEDTDNFQVFRQALNNLKVPYTLVMGLYGGKQEMSFMLDKNDVTLEIAKQVAKQFNQDCILLIDNEGTGTLDFTKGYSETLGKLRVTNSKPSGDHSKIVGHEEYFYFI